MLSESDHGQGECGIQDLPGAVDKNGTQLRAGDIVLEVILFRDSEKFNFRELRAAIPGHGMIICSEIANSPENARIGPRASITVADLSKMKLVTESRDLTKLGSSTVADLQARIAKSLEMARRFAIPPEDIPRSDPPQKVRPTNFIGSRKG